MILTNSTSSKVGPTNVNAIASATAAFLQFMVYLATTISQAITGSVGLIKNGTGTLTLTANNTYTGATTINAGTLQIGNNSPASIASTSIVNNANLIYSTNIASGTSSLASSTTGTGNLTATALLIKLNGNITQSGNVSLTGSTAAIFFGSGIELVSDTTIAAGNITITGDLGRRTANGGNLTLNTSATNGAINLDISISRSGVWYGFTTFTVNAGTGNLTVSGLNASNAIWTATSGLSLVGALNISSNLNIVISALNLTATANSSVTGNLSLSGTTNTWTVNSGLTMTISGNISGTSAAITKNGTGTLTLSGNNSYTGGTTISAGTLEIGSAGRLGGGSYAGAIANSGNFIYSGTNAQTLSGIISGTGALTQNAASTLTLSGNNTYSGTTTINAGTLLLNNANAITGSAVTVANGATLSMSGYLTYLNTNPVTITGTGAPGQNGALYLMNVVVWAAPIILNGNSTIFSYGGALNSTLNGAITGTGNLSLVSQGGSPSHNAPWLLNAASTYNGSTVIRNSDGLLDITVKLGVNNALPTTTSLNLEGATSQAVNTFTTLDLNGKNQTLAGLTDTNSSSASAGVTFGKRVINSSSTLSTLTLNIVSGTNTYGTSVIRVLAGTIGGTTAAGVAANNLALTKTGAGALFLDGDLTYTGATSIAVGTLRAKKTVGASTATATFTGGGTSLSVAFNVAPPSATTTNFRFFQGTTTQTYGTITLTGVPAGTTATYTSATSTLAVTVP